MFAVFLARPCPFYILDEVEAALDDLNIDRFLQLVRRYSDRAQFIVVTHQKRTMDAADTLYGVSMGGDSISRVVSRKLGDSSADKVAADLSRVTRTWQELFVTGEDVRRRRPIERAPRVPPAPAREHVEDAPGPRGGAQASVSSGSTTRPWSWTEEALIFADVGAPRRRSSSGLEDEVEEG